ncbi:hypothetical protein AGDE_13634 [Angomonas deanei]|nr:hypothetical protein AGDE_13634 [Angomonas deanei]|eukprot:EPY22042.1 hypothetical protein AGDE_13634 [Angomonas deanei]
MERMGNAIIDLLHSAAQESPSSPEASSTTEEPKSGSASQEDTPIPAPRHRASTATKGHRHPRYDPSTGLWEEEGEIPVKKGLAAKPFMAQLEDRISAALEDSGIASWADFRITAFGDVPPVIKAVHLVQGGATSSASSSSPTAGGEGNSSNNNSNNPMSSSVNGNKPKVSTDPRGRATTPSSTYARKGNKGKDGPDLASGATDSSVDPSSVELEMEVEYGGSLDVSLKADLSFARGRQLPVYAHIGGLKYIRAHIRLLAKLQYEAATLETPEKPYLLCHIFFESDPMFEMQLHTSLTPLNIQDFMLVPFLAKFFLLRFIRSKMKRSAGGNGAQFKIPLPEDVVDRGAQFWCNPYNDDLSEETARFASVLGKKW